MVMLTATIRDDVGAPLGILVLREKVFSTGRTGWYGQGRITVDGRVCQCQAQCVILIRDDAAAAAAAAAADAREGASA